MENRSLSFEGDHLNFKATELRLGLPGSQEPEKQRRTVAKNNKRVSLEMAYEECRSNSNSKSNSFNTRNDEQEDAPPTKTQVVGWPPIRSYRKNSMQPKKDNEAESGGGVYVKVSVDGVPYLRKIDLMFYKSYLEFLKALENLFKLTIGKYSETEGYGTSDYAPTYEDKDGDWMLVGDVPWDMFVSSCKRLRIMTGSGAIGLTCE